MLATEIENDYCRLTISSRIWDICTSSPHFGRRHILVRTLCYAHVFKISLYPVLHVLRCFADSVLTLKVKQSKRWSEGRSKRTLNLEWKVAATNYIPDVAVTTNPRKLSNLRLEFEQF